MAGIGFELRKILSGKSATSYFRAYCYTAVVTVGPFVLVTAMILAIQKMLDGMNGVYHVRELFTLSVVYPFIFSQIAASGFGMVITRFLADKLYAGDYEDVMPSLYGMLALALGVGAVPALWFLWRVPLAFELKLATYILYMLLIIVGVEGIYLTALKDYIKVVKSYAYGMVTAIGLAFAVLKYQMFSPAFGVLLAVDIGVFITVFCLLLNIKKFFRHSGNRHFLFLRFFETHFPLFIINFCYTLALYIPNFIIWQGPLAVWVADTYVYAPLYDVATFYAFLSIVPSMIIFVITTELAFYDKYAAYFNLITEQGNYKEIEEARKSLLQVMWSEIRNNVELQLVFSLVFLALGNFLLPRIGLSYAAINMYNLLVLGAFCNALVLIIITLLLYLEDRKGALWSAVLFLATNTAFNWASLKLGEITYGFGFFAAAFISVVVSLLRMSYYTDKLDYYVFCSQPVFSNSKPGLLSRLVDRLYSED